MALPAYATDLALIVDFDTVSGTIAEPGSVWTAGRQPATDTDFPIEGTVHASLVMNTTGKAGILATASAFTWTAGHYLFGWITWLAMGAITSRATGGLVMLCGSDASNQKVFYVAGNDWGTAPYGGWYNFAVDPQLTQDETLGTAPTAFNSVGGGANVASAVAKGNPLGIDVFRYGRGELRVNGGQAGDYATFAGMAAANDASTAKWGLFQEIAGGYLWKGLINLGFGSLVNFIDANKSIVIDGIPIFVNSTFNKIEIRTTGSYVEWDTIQITSLNTIAKGDFEVIDDVSISKTNCTFVDMGTFIYQPNSFILSSIYRRCDQVTQNGALFNGCKFINSPAAVSIVASNPSQVFGCEFTSDGSNHAMRATVAGDWDWDNTLTGYATSDGSTGNEAFFNDSGGHINLTVIGGTVPKVRNGSGATTTVIIPSVTLTIAANLSLVGAEIRIYDNNGPAGNFGDELAGVESCPTATYNYPGTASNLIYIQIMKDGYEEFGQDFVMPSANSTFTAVLIVDNNI